MAFIIIPPPDFLGGGVGVDSSAASAMSADPSAASLPQQDLSKFYAMAVLDIFIVTGQCVMKFGLPRRRRLLAHRTAARGGPPGI
jgi:hypothetical protein